MTGRERVKAALTFAAPDRTPRDLWALPYIRMFRKNELVEVLQEFPLDIQNRELIPGWDDKGLYAYGQTGHYTDDWGSVWYIGEPGIIGEVKEPVLANWSDLKTFKPPWDLVRKRDLSNVNQMCDESDQFMLSDVTARPFERLQFLRGTENLFIDIAYGTAEVRTLLEIVHDFYLEDIRAWCESYVDAIFFMDDWGTNNSLLINPKTWRELFKPLYKEYCELIHAAGKFAFFHSDGNIEAIFGDLVEVGIDAINSQLFCMDIEGLARRYKGKVTFCGEIDRQNVLPFGDSNAVCEAVMRVRRVLDDGSGGVIAHCEWGKDNSQENIRTVFKTWLQSAN